MGINQGELLQLRQAVQTNSFDPKGAEVQKVVNDILAQPQASLMTANGSKERDMALAKLREVAQKRIASNQHTINDILAQRSSGALSQAQARAQVGSISDFRGMSDHPDIKNLLNSIP